MKSKIKNYFKEYIVLLRSVPAIIVTLFVVSVIVMNLLANKTLIQEEYIAIDGGILISWLAFLSMDVITKHFGPRAANKLSVFAIVINSFICLIFFIASIIPTKTDYTVFNEIIGGTWFILLSSTIAFLASAIINNFLNYYSGKLFKKNPNGSLAFTIRMMISTFVGQFFDNFIFALLCFKLFSPIFWDGFSWTFIQCLTCSILGAILELLLEIFFAPIGYKICKNWKENNIGKEYFEFRGEKHESIN